MVQRSPRWRKPPPHILSTPESVRTVACYAAQGKGEYRAPLATTRFHLVLIDPSREVLIVPGYAPHQWTFHTDAIENGSAWLVLGWRPPDGSLPHGDLDLVDPDLADLKKLRAPNQKPCGQAVATCGTRTALPRPSCPA
jgi:hypothetical protein